MKNYDLIIIGSSPATFSVIHYLKNHSELKVLIIEKGKHFSKRKCPVDNGNNCFGCGGICNVISGFGGCIHYGDGLKLGFYPSPKELIKLLGDEVTKKYSDKTLNIISKSIGRTIKISHSDDETLKSIFKSKYIQTRYYPVEIISETELKTFIETTFDYLLKSPNIDIKFETTASDINYINNKFKVSCKENSKNQRDYYSSNLFIATGRKGIDFPNMMKDLNLNYEKPKISYGVRFEMPHHVLSKIGHMYPDLKISYKNKHIALKTFCFCGGLKGGRIKYTKYNNFFGFDAIILDGHIISERNINFNYPANFGLLIRETPDYFDEKWHTSILKKYSEISNCKPIVQPYNDFKSKKYSQYDWELLKKKLTFIPSVNDLTHKPLFQLFSEKNHSYIIDGFEEILKNILEFSMHKRCIDETLKDTLVVGLEFEYFWNKIKINENFMTEIPGLYVIGDANGLNQGFVPAMMSGLIASKNRR